MADKRKPNQVKDDQQIGDVVRVLRDACGLSQEDLAEKLGMSRQAFSELELGKRALKSYQIRIIADTLKVTPNVLFSYEENLTGPIERLEAHIILNRLDDEQYQYAINMLKGIVNVKKCK